MLDSLFLHPAKVYKKIGKNLDSSIKYAGSPTTCSGILIFATAQDIDDLFGKVNANAIILLKDIDIVAEGDRVLLEDTNYNVKEVRRLNDIHGVLEGWKVAV